MREALALEGLDLDDLLDERGVVIITPGDHFTPCLRAMARVQGF